MASANWWLGIIDAYAAIVALDSTVPPLSFSREPEGNGLPAVLIKDPGEIGFVYGAGQRVPQRSEKAVRFEIYAADGDAVEALAAKIIGTETTGLHPRCLSVTGATTYVMLCTLRRREGEVKIQTPTPRQKAFLFVLEYQILP